MASVHATRSSDATQWPISSCASDAERYSTFLCPAGVSSRSRSCAKPAMRFLLDSYVKTSDLPIRPGRSRAPVPRSM